MRVPRVISSTAPSHSRRPPLCCSAKGKRLFFVTNNSSKSRAQYLDKFAKLGIQASIEEVLPSSWAAAEFLRSEHPHVHKAFVIGSQGLVDELTLVGVESVGGADPAYASRTFHSEADFLEARTVMRTVGVERRDIRAVRGTY